MSDKISDALKVKFQKARADQKLVVLILLARDAEEVSGTRKERIKKIAGQTEATLECLRPMFEELGVEVTRILGLLRLIQVRCTFEALKKLSESAEIESFLDPMARFHILATRPAI